MKGRKFHLARGETHVVLGHAASINGEAHVEVTSPLHEGLTLTLPQKMVEALINKYPHSRPQAG